MNTRIPAPVKRLSRIGGALALATGAALSLGSSVASAQSINFQGNTDGCFGMDCAPGATATLDGLTYRDSTFNVTTAGGFASIGNLPAPANLNNLGSFDLVGSPFEIDFGGARFELTVNFTVPSTTTPNSVVIASALSGMVSTTNNGGVFIDFDSAPSVFTFGSGANASTFTFFANDLSVTTSGTVAVTGVLRAQQVSAIPEPETYALMMAGLAAVGFMSRRRKKA